MGSYTNKMQVGKGSIAWSNPAFRMVLDQRGNKLFCGSLAECLEYLKHWDECYSN